VAPVALTVDPPPGPVDPGQQVQLTGTLRNDRNEPVAGHSILAVTDPALDARAFGKVGDDGTWIIDFVVPGTAGQWSETFPDYRVAVVFEGDWWLAPGDPLRELSAAAPQGPLPVWLPGWVASPVFALSVGSFLALLLGATLISHARRG
jgi:hypothetical protein